MLLINGRRIIVMQMLLSKLKQMYDDEFDKAIAENGDVLVECGKIYEFKAKERKEEGVPVKLTIHEKEVKAEEPLTES